MRQHNYYLYIMGSVSRTLYTGVTNDLERRSMEHKEAKPGSFTARYKVNQLVYFEHFSDIDQAIDRETEIKSMARRTKVRLIESMNPDWLDLSQLTEAAAKGSGIPRAAATRGNDRSRAVR